MVYYLLVYFTSESLAMVLLFIGLFVAFEAVLLRKEIQRIGVTFSIIYYGFGDAGRYSYYGEPQKIRQVFLSKVRIMAASHVRNSMRSHPSNSRL